MENDLHMLALQASSKIAILGGGLMGRLLALALAQRGHRIDLYDAHGPEGDGAAARVAAAMLAPLAESAITEPGVVRMGQHGLKRWPELIAQLDAPVFLQQNGTLWSGTARMHPMPAAFSACSRKTAASTPAAGAGKRQRADGHREPALQGRFQQGVYLPGEGQLDNRQLLAALESTLARLGVQLHWHTARETTTLPRHAGQPDLVLDCRGLGARTSGARCAAFAARWCASTRPKSRCSAPRA
jgi:glycine oxidase